MKYHYYDFTFEPRYTNLGTKHTRRYKAIDLEHALKQAKRDEKFSVDGQQVYKVADNGKEVL